jgi:hypothetical protein
MFVTPEVSAQKLAFDKQVRELQNVATSLFEASQFLCAVHMQACYFM